mmetsp:Transcript_24237/g.57097  ORF Transcript_24237/g.57097 Transcript_24237/m.57097 type:complete len:151 (-) Transcript_24237:1537-1989(-)
MVVSYDRCLQEGPAKDGVYTGENGRRSHQHQGETRKAERHSRPDVVVRPGGHQAEGHRSAEKPQQAPAEHVLKEANVTEQLLARLIELILLVAVRGGMVAVGYIDVVVAPTTGFPSSGSALEVREYAVLLYPLAIPPNYFETIVSRPSFQ